MAKRPHRKGIFRNRWFKITGERNARIVELTEQGVPRDQIAAQMKMTPDAVKMVLYRINKSKKD